jgi:hypothetical protein
MPARSDRPGAQRDRGDEDPSKHRDWTVFHGESWIGSEPCACAHGANGRGRAANGHRFGATGARLVIAVA